MEKLLYRKTSTNHYFGVESWPLVKEDSSISTLSEEVSCWKDLEYIDKSSKIPKKDILYPIHPRWCHLKPTKKPKVEKPL